MKKNAVYIADYRWLALVLLASVVLASSQKNAGFWMQG